MSTDGYPETLPARYHCVGYWWPQQSPFRAGLYGICWGTSPPSEPFGPAYFWNNAKGQYVREGDGMSR